MVGLVRGVGFRGGLGIVRMLVCGGGDVALFLVLGDCVGGGIGVG